LKLGYPEIFEIASGYCYYYENNI